MRKVVLTPIALEELEEWAHDDPRVVKKIFALLKEVRRTPFVGTGKPEALKRNLQGFWSRRITGEHRLIYKVTDEAIEVVKCRGHYME